ncbi:MAG TPA: hypothetical protein VFO80_09385 [Sphingomonas sp.]|nr:hypothetical protein [Sphingomonas sp.]
MRATNRILMCFSGMVPAQHDTNAPYVVASPRSGDAVGAALRTAFADTRLPEDMLALLRKLNDGPDINRN